MKFIVWYYVGSSLRQKGIMASSLDEAERIADETFKNWEDIIMVDKTRGEKSYE